MAGWRSAIVVVGLGISLSLVAPPLATSAPQQPAAAGTNGGFATQHQVIAASGEQRVAPWGPDSVGGSFSPDGRALAWVRHVIKRAEDDVSLWVTDGAGSRQVFPLMLNMGLPSWSPDGTRFVVGGGNFGMTSSRSEVWVVPVDGSGPPTQLLKAGGGDLFEVAWSPDGSKIAFVRGYRDVFTYDVTTGAITQVTHGCTWKSTDPKTPMLDCAVQYGFEGSFTWSPDGTRLAATDRKSVVTIDMATGAVTPILTGKKWACERAVVAGRPVDRLRRPR